MDLPDSFDANSDWGTKEQWQRAKPYIKCPVCRAGLSKVWERTVDSRNEHDLYDAFDKICGDADYFNEFTIVDPREGPREIAKEKARTTKEKAVKELEAR